MMTMRIQSQAFDDLRSVRDDYQELYNRVVLTWMPITRMTY